MPTRPTPPAPPRKPSSSNKPAGQTPIADMRERFARQAPQRGEDDARARAFIAGKIDMVRADRTMSEAEKSAAIADLERRSQK